MNIDYNLIGSRIKEARKACGLTQEKLAEKLDVSIGYVSQVERGTTKISLDLLGAIAGIVQKELPYFVSVANFSAENYLSNEIADDFERLSVRDKSLIKDFIKTMLNNK